MLYIDANVFIFSILGEEKLRETSLKIIKDINNKKIVAFTSCLTFDEVAYVIKKHLNDEVFYETLEGLLSLNIKWLDVNILIIRESSNLIKEYNLSPRDAIHVATMKINNIRNILSEDSDFNKIKEIKRIKLSDL